MKKDWIGVYGKTLFSQLKQKGVNLFKKQEQLVQNGDIAKWDFTLLASILLMGRRHNFWGLSAHQCVAINELRDKRNNLCCHNPSASILTNDFEKQVKEINRAVTTLFSGTKGTNVVSSINEAARGNFIIILYIIILKLL